MIQDQVATDVPMDQWAWWCRDNQALQERGLGHASCLVCAAEPTEVLAWECSPPQCFATAHLQHNVTHHALFKGCGHRVDIIFSWDALERMYP